MKKKKNKNKKTNPLNDVAGVVSIVVARVGVKLASILEISIYKKKKKEKKQTNQRPCRGTWPASSCVVVAVVVLVIVAV